LLQLSLTLLGSFEEATLIPSLLSDSLTAPSLPISVEYPVCLPQGDGSVMQLRLAEKHLDYELRSPSLKMTG
jgi:hypothetical protein